MADDVQPDREVEEAADDSWIEETWRTFLMEGYNYAPERRWKDILSILPGDMRCRFCGAPLSGAGYPIARVFFDKRRSAFMPHLCNACDVFATQHQGGAEVEMSMLFADIRGSTSLAEQMGTAAFSKLINRFYTIATRTLNHMDGWIDKLAGNQVTAYFFPAFAGPEHAHRALEAAQALLAATGHNNPEGPWVPVGVGVHTGEAYMGSVGTKDGMVDVTALGDPVNVAARLASKAAAGEILFSAEVVQASGVPVAGLETRTLDLKGKSEDMTVHVLDVSTA